jgi:hypothetical protein
MSGHAERQWLRHDRLEEMEVVTLPRKQVLLGCCDTRPLKIDRGQSSSVILCGTLPWARGILFQKLHSVARFFNLSNNLGNLLFARQTSQTGSTDGVLIRF